MKQFRKKPVVIEAEQYLPGNEMSKEIPLNFNGESVNIETLEGSMRVSPGDWIIKGVNGEFYPCKPDIFEKTYEAEK